MKKLHLNYDWKYRSDFKEEYISSDYQDDSFELVNLPHTNKVLPYNNFDEKLYQFESCYRKEIWIDEIAEDERVYIKFEGIMTGFIGSKDQIQIVKKFIEDFKDERTTVIVDPAMGENGT